MLEEELQDYQSGKQLTMLQNKLRDVSKVWYCPTSLLKQTRQPNLVLFYLTDLYYDYHFYIHPRQYLFNVDLLVHFDQLCSKEFEHQQFTPCFHVQVTTFTQHSTICEKTILYQLEAVKLFARPPEKIEGVLKSYYRTNIFLVNKPL